MTGLHLSAFLQGFKLLTATAGRLIESRTILAENEDFRASKALESDRLFNTVTEKANKSSSDAIPSVEYCTAHLQLLGLFVDLRDRVEEWGTSSGMPGNDAWQDFVKLAVARFNHWFRTAPPLVIEMERSVPPLDVLMAWHSFMLNPHAYHAFCKSARSDSAGLAGISWSQLECSISPDGNCFQLSKQDAAVIEAMGLHSDLLLALTSSTKSSRSGLIDISSSRHDALETDGRLRAILDTYHHELSATDPISKPPNLDFDLAGAVQRQAAFALKMARFGWQHSPTRDSTLQRARERYRRFFSLIPTLPAGASAVPTLDIDLVWHTHQLSPARYAAYSRAATNGRLVNHDDTIAQEDATRGSKNTATVYRETFGGDVYSICLSWYCEAARRAAGGRLSERDVARVSDAIHSQQQRSGRKLDLAQCRCHEVAAMAAAFASMGPADGNAPPAGGRGHCGGSVGVNAGGCEVPDASCMGGCGGCGASYGGCAG